MLSADIFRMALSIVSKLLVQQFLGHFQALLSKLHNLFIHRVFLFFSSLVQVNNLLGLELLTLDSFLV